MFKAPGTGEEHGNIKFITSVDHFLVPNGASGLHDNLYSGIFDGINAVPDRKSTRLNSSHKPISYAVFCLKKKKQKKKIKRRTKKFMITDPTVAQ